MKENVSERTNPQNTRVEKFGEDKLIVRFSCRAITHDQKLAPAFQEVVVCFGKGVNVRPILDRIHETQPAVLPQVSESLKRRNVDQEIETALLRQARRQIRRVTYQGGETVCKEK